MQLHKQTNQDYDVASNKHFYFLIRSWFSQTLCKLETRAGLGRQLVAQLRALGPSGAQRARGVRAPALRFVCNWGRREYRDCRGRLVGLWLHVLTLLFLTNGCRMILSSDEPQNPQSRIKGFLDHYFCWYLVRGLSYFYFLGMGPV